jgi:Tol biopolymer transport system component
LCVEAVTEQPNCLHIYDFESKRSRKLLGKEWAVVYAGATWSPDGKRVVFVGQNGGLEHLATADVEIGEPSVKILYTERNQRRKLIGPPVWSPDGDQIVFAIQEPDRPETNRRQWPYTYLYSISAEVPSAPVLLEGEEVGLINRGMKFSPDSRKIVFSSER